MLSTAGRLLTAAVCQVVRPENLDEAGRVNFFIKFLYGKQAAEEDAMREQTEDPQVR